MENMLRFTDTTQLETQLTLTIIEQLKQAITRKGEASLVVSGGRTPIGLFEKLSHHPIQWEKVFITLADERWTAIDTPESNEYTIRRYLLKNFAHTAHFIGLKTPAATARAGINDIEQRLRTLPKPFDVVILGMGEDGHTASLFPNSENLSIALDPHAHHTCLAITPNTAPFERISLTLNTLLTSKQIYLHLVGENKKLVLEQALAGEDCLAMPIRAILQQDKVPVTIFWSPVAVS